MNIIVEVKKKKKKFSLTKYRIYMIIYNYHTLAGKLFKLNPN